MKISVNLSSENGVTVALSGEFDAAGCKAIREELEASVPLSCDNTLSLDLKDVTFLDSSGIGAIVYLFKRVSVVNGTLKVINVDGQPRELMTLLRVNEAIPVVWLNEAC